MALHRSQWYNLQMTTCESVQKLMNDDPEKYPNLIDAFRHIFEIAKGTRLDIGFQKTDFKNSFIYFYEFYMQNAHDLKELNV